MAKYASFRELVVWQKGMDLAEKVHRATRPFPSEDLFTIGTQLRRAANSILPNVSEGFSRRSRGAYRSHVAIALGSHAEVQTLLELCRRLSLIGQNSIRELQSLAEDIGRLLFGTLEISFRRRGLLFFDFAGRVRVSTVGRVLLSPSMTLRSYLGLGPFALGLPAWTSSRR